MQPITRDVTSAAHLPPGTPSRAGNTHTHTQYALHFSQQSFRDNTESFNQPHIIMSYLPTLHASPSSRCACASSTSFCADSATLTALPAGLPSLILKRQLARSLQKNNRSNLAKNQGRKPASLNGSPFERWTGLHACSHTSHPSSGTMPCCHDHPECVKQDAKGHPCNRANPDPADLATKVTASAYCIHHNSKVARAPANELIDTL